MALYNYHDFEDKCIIDHDISNIIDTKTIMTHDGYDEYGPESELFDFYVLYQKSNEIFLNNFHRENWFRGEVEEYYLCKTINISQKLKEKGFIKHYLFKYSKNALAKIFIKEIYSKIMDNYQIYNPLGIRFNKCNENVNLYQIDDQINIYFDKFGSNILD